jgi:DNA primase small subunit
MNIDTKIFLKKKFKEYYSRNKIPAPEDVEHREFGVGTLETKIKVRHKSFKTDRDLQNYLRREAPYYISYSSAYYEFPENQPMAAKNWLGADLVFDLDVDMDLLNPVKLEKVKEETLSLMDLLLDFGFSRGDLEVNFSGSKGYHIHVSREEVKSLDNAERREIVDYVAGNINFRDYLRVEGDKILGPKKGDLGWPGRIYRGLYDLIKNSDKKQLEEVRGIGEKKAELIYRDRDMLLREIDAGRYNYIPDIVTVDISYVQTSDPNVRFPVIKKVSSPIIQKIIDERAVKTMAATDTDKMVTIDTTRLIRLPDTLHGGSGLTAKKIREVAEFNPLTDALAFGDEEIKIDIREEIPDLDMNEQKFRNLTGVVEVPECLGVYLMLKDKAEFVRD